MFPPRAEPLAGRRARQQFPSRAEPLAGGVAPGGVRGGRCSFPPRAPDDAADGGSAGQCADGTHLCAGIVLGRADLLAGC